MSTSKNIRLAAVGAAIVALGAAGAAVAASKLSDGGSGAAVRLGTGSFVASGTLRFDGRAHGGPGGPGLSAAASYLGLTESDLMQQLQSGKTLAQIADATAGKSEAGLVDALVADAKAHIAADVSSGALTQAQADQMLANLQQRITDMVEHGPPLVHGHGPGDELAAAADYLGTTQSDLLTQLQAGKTLGEIADATAGKSRAGLVAALVAHEKTELAQAVTDGRLTQAQADELATHVADRVTHVVDGTLPSPPAGAPPLGAPPTL